MITELQRQRLKAGLSMNLNKTKIMTTNTSNERLNIGGGKIECVNEVVYLGPLIISFENRGGKELNRRIASGWKK